MHLDDLVRVYSWLQLWLLVMTVVTCPSSFNLDYLYQILHLFIFTLSILILSAFHTKYRASTPSHHCMHGATGTCLRPIPEIFGNFNFVEVLIFYNRKNLLLVLIFLKTFSRVISLVHLIVVAASFKMSVLFDFNRCWLGQYIHILLLRLRWLRVSLVLAWS